MDEPNTGGLGGSPQEPEIVGARDARMLERSISEGWPVTPEMRQKGVERIYEALKSDKLSVRSRCSLVKTLAHLDAENRKAMTEAGDLIPRAEALVKHERLLRALVRYIRDQKDLQSAFDDYFGLTGHVPPMLIESRDAS